MAETCKNCAHEITLNFCGNCGQKKFKRIDVHYLKDELQYTVLHTNKGFFYTCKHLLRRPGHATREFVEGNRVNHYKPLLLVFLLAGINAFIAHFTIDFESLYGQMMDEKQVAMATKGAEYFMKYQSFFMVSVIPVFSLVTWLVFRRWGYNYFEHIVINCFFTAAQLMLGILLTPVTYLMMQSGATVGPYLFLQYALSLGVMVWFFRQFYDSKSLGAVISRLLILLVCTILLFAAVLVLMGIVIGIMMALSQHK